MGKLIYFDISSDFGFFKKPDINKFSLTYNLPPKPAILGILGSILGMKGLAQHYEQNAKLSELLGVKNVLEKDYNKAKKIAAKLNLSPISEILKNMKHYNKDRLFELINLLKSSKEKEFESNKNELCQLLDELQSELTYPEYYRKLNHLKIGITPIGKFPFNKIMNKYNSKNSYFYTVIDKTTGKFAENVLVSEQLLITPRYRIYVYDESGQAIITEFVKRITTNSPVYMPYLGKNEFIANIENCTQIEYAEKISNFSKGKVGSVFLKSDSASVEEDEELEGSPNGGSPSVSVEGLPGGFIFFEQYPKGYSGAGLQYDLRLAEYTGIDVQHSKIDTNSGILLKIDKQIIYLF